MRRSRSSPRGWKRRVPGNRRGAPVMLIAYDGELTEHEYFKGWQRTLGRAGIDIAPIYVRSGGNVLSAVEAATKVARQDGGYDEFWCMCDVDDSSAADIASATALAAQMGMELCLSVRCFEVWIALHFARSSRPITCEDDAIKIVQAHFPLYGGRRGKFVPFDLLRPLTGVALANAEWLGRQGCANPATDVGKLVVKLQARLIAATEPTRP